MTGESGAVLQLVECPIFDELDRVAMAFACELTTTQGRNAPDTGYRLTGIYRELFGPAREPRIAGSAEADLIRARRLFDASRSFLEDITTGPPGTNGRPMMLSAALDKDGSSGTRARIIRPASWRYEFENAEIELGVPEHRRTIDVTFNDHFCIFESGRIFYLAIFGQDRQEGPRLDEYALIQLERLIIDPQGADSSDAPAFALVDKSAPGSAESVSLREFVMRRLRALDDAQSPEPNAIRDVLRPFGIVGEGAALHLPDRGWLKNGLVQVEDKDLLFAARYANEHYCLETPKADRDPALPERGKKIEGWDARWRRRHLQPSNPGSMRPHHAPLFDVEGETGTADEADDEIVDRPLLAFAGLAQGIPDFPRQDDSEIHDSTRPATSATEGMFYVHPAFELAVGINWRTFSDAQHSVGGCPYAILAWIIGLHDEVIVADMERRIERMIYGSPARGDPPGKISARELGRAQPAGDLMRVWRNAASWRPRRTMIAANLRARLDIFRWCSIHRSGNVFRYPTERELLAAIGQCRGTDARFDHAHATLDRYENLVEDLSSLTANYAAARANWLLGAIAVLGLIGLPTAISGTVELLGLPFDPLWTTLVILVIALALFFLWNRASRRS